MFMQLADSGYVDLTIRRDGQLLTLDRFPLGMSVVTITGLVDGFIPNEGEQKLLVGDTIISVNGESMHESFSVILDQADTGYMDLVISRNGEIINLIDFPFRRHEYMTDGELEYRFGIEFFQVALFRTLSFNRIDASVGETLKYSVYSTVNNLRLIRVSLAMIFRGDAGVRDLGGPVAIVDMVNTIGQVSPSVGDAIANIASFVAFLGVNLAIVNLLPIPSLDGGRILLILITWVIEKFTRKEPDPKYEAYIHNTAFLLLMGVMIFFVINDVMRIMG
jgi:regulator of sigma E protease